MSYLTVENINKSYNGQTVLKSIHFSLEEGEFLTLLGPSGCGKSTLLRILSGLTDADSGVLKIAGKDITHVRAKNRNIGMVFQSYALFPNMTVAENIAFGLQMKKVTKQEIVRKVAEIIEMVGLTGKERSYPRELSGGQQQRVALARALIVEPDVLLLDEPLSALDAQIRKSLQKLLRDIQQKLKMTTILVTHDQEEAMIMSDRIFLLHNGEIVQSGTPHSLYTQPKNEFVARFIGNYNVLTKNELKKLLGVSAFPADLYAIRPEAFTTQMVDESYVIDGSILNTTLLGNILRYEMQANDVPFLADFLHHTYEETVEGEMKRLYIRHKDVIPL